MIYPLSRDSECPRGLILLAEEKVESGRMSNLLEKEAFLWLRKRKQNK